MNSFRSPSNWNQFVSKNSELTHNQAANQTHTFAMMHQTKGIILHSEDKKGAIVCDETVCDSEDVVK